ncbi:MAG TPA: carboxynorspermidine decarboxylase [Polyangiales bacterium]|nr:carboxynorspermidine decarboxylase [Polyangiales bacterium]
MQLDTPYYLIDEGRMSVAMDRIRQVHSLSGAKCVLALKCFSAWCAFEFMKESLAGTTSSSLYEARLGYEKFGGETHGYSVAYDEAEIREVGRYCDKVIFNSLGQLERFRRHVAASSVGLRLNPEIGHSAHTLSDPTGRYSRLGVRAKDLPRELADRIDGAMVHVNCDNQDFASFCRQLERIEARFGSLLRKLRWFSLGGGIAFTSDGYPLADFCRRLAGFSTEYGLQLYLEPGEAAVTGSTSLVVQVLDIVHNEVPTLIVDAGVETHLLDVLTYGFTPELEGATALPRSGLDLAELRGRVYRVCGRTCLAGDHFGNYVLDHEVQIGDRLRFPDVAGYSLVKKNFFNGIRMPAIYHKRLDGAVHLAHRPTYEDFRDALSS